MSDVEDIPADREGPDGAGASEDFTPRGTALLLGLYMLILALLWCFMYFVEFIGRGPTIIPG